MGRRIQVAKEAIKIPSYDDIESLIGTLCYYYPQYTFKQAEQLPLRRIISLLKVASQQQALYYKNMTQIIAAPHSKKATNVRKLIDHYNGIIKSG